MEDALITFDPLAIPSTSRIPTCPILKLLPNAALSFIAAVPGCGHLQTVSQNAQPNGIINLPEIVFGTIVAHLLVFRREISDEMA